MKPLVGITAWKRSLATSLGTESLQTLSSYYSDAVIAAGMDPIMFPAGQSPDTAERFLSLVDGLVLSGGDDIDPTSYGSERTAAKNFEEEVDLFELALIQAARRHEIPVLAICRGLQILNVALGGTLHQDMLASGTVHEPITPDDEPDEINARRHVVTFESDSVVGHLYGATEAKVNTLHHQSIDSLAAELVVEAYTDDGHIEAARCEGNWWALGVQWHPERMDSSHQHLFVAFRNAIEDSQTG